MPRTVQGDRDELEQKIGPRGSTKINSANRNDARAWLRARGCPSEIVQSLEVTILDKAYNDESHFTEMTAVIDKVARTVSPFSPPISQQEPEPMAQAAANPFARNNRFAGRCADCDKHVPGGEGVLIASSMGNKVYCAEHAPKAEAAQDAAFTKAAEPFKPAEIKTPKPSTTPQDAGSAITAAIAAMVAAMPAAMDEAKIIELIKHHGSQPIVQETTITIIIPNQEPRTLPKDQHRHEVFPSVLRKVAAGRHVYLVGPAGSGKSTIAQQVAEALERPLYSTNAVQSPFALTGYMDAKGEYQRSPFRDAYELGGVFLFDEMDSSSAEALTTFNGALAQDVFAFPDGMKSRHKDFVCIAAANTIGKGADRLYVGRQQLDAATLDRYAFVTMDYDEAFELAVSSNAKWTRHVQTLRHAAAELKVRHVISPRASINGGVLLAAGEAWPEVEDAVIWKGLDADSRAKITTRAKELSRKAA